MITNGKNKKLGKIRVTVEGTIPEDIEAKLQTALLVLKNHNIEIITDKISSNDDGLIIFEILDIGDISEKHMKDALKDIFLRYKGNKNFVRLIQEKKVFELPDDYDECMDWFIIED